MPRPLVIGIGNEFRGDDGAGLLVADLVASSGADLDVRRHEGDGAALLEMWAGAETVILVDAMVSGAPAGTVRHFAGEDEVPRTCFGASTHLVNVAESVALARLLGRLPRRLLLIGVEGASFTPGAPLSPEVEASARRLAAGIPDLAAEMVGAKGVMRDNS